MSWKKVALQVGLLALDYGMKRRKKRKPAKKKRKTTTTKKRKG